MVELLDKEAAQLKKAMDDAAAAALEKHTLRVK